MPIEGLLNVLQAGVRAALGQSFTGLYLHGSIALGAFDPACSDVDFLVATTTDLDVGRMAALADLHARIAVSGLPWSRNYEGSYIPLRALRRYDPEAAIHPAVEVDGSFGLRQHGPDWVIQRQILREHGVPLAGPPPTTLIDPIAPNDLRRAQRAVLEWRWRPVLEDPGALPTSEYQAYAVLTMCRARFTLATGRVAAKPEAARWAQARLDQRWHDLIEAALAWRHGETLDRLSGVLEFIRSTLEGCA